jgi:hypothetical protein
VCSVTEAHTMLPDYPRLARPHGLHRRLATMRKLALLSAAFALVAVGF